MEFDLSCSLQLYQYSRSTGISERGHALQSHTQSSAGRLVVLHYGCRASLLPDIAPLGHQAGAALSAGALVTYQSTL